LLNIRPIVNNIIWLASYPKSGNTWFRSFLAALKASDSFLDINNLNSDGLFSGKDKFESVLEIDSDFLYFDEIQKYQSLVWNHISSKAEQKQFVKIHDSFNFVSFDIKKSLIPEEATYKAVYIVRNPFDVVSSLANHIGSTVEFSATFLNRSDAYFGEPFNKRKGGDQFYQHLGTWNEHVKSWLIHPSFPVLFIRYEDMKMNSFITFKNALEFIELSYSDDQIKQALDMTSFEKLRKQEEDNGFKEKSSKAKYFFNKGEINYGESLLSEEQIESIKSVNEEMMRHFGYWQ